MQFTGNMHPGSASAESNGRDVADGPSGSIAGVRFDPLPPRRRRRAPDADNSADTRTPTAAPIPLRIPAASHSTVNSNAEPNAHNATHARTPALRRVQDDDAAAIDNIFDVTIEMETDGGDAGAAGGDGEAHMDRVLQRVFTYLLGGGIGGADDMAGVAVNGDGATTAATTASEAATTNVTNETNGSENNNESNADTGRPAALRSMQPGRRVLFATRRGPSQLLPIGGMPGMGITELFFTIPIMDEYQMNTMLSDMLGNVEVGVSDIDRASTKFNLAEHPELAAHVCPICQDSVGTTTAADTPGRWQ